MCFLYLESSFSPQINDLCIIFLKYLNTSNIRKLIFEIFIKFHFQTTTSQPEFGSLITLQPNIIINRRDSLKRVYPNRIWIATTSCANPPQNPAQPSPILASQTTSQHWGTNLVRRQMCLLVRDAPASHQIALRSHKKRT